RTVVERHALLLLIEIGVGLVCGIRSGPDLVCLFDASLAHDALDARAAEGELELTPARRPRRFRWRYWRYCGRLFSRLSPLVLPPPPGGEGEQPKCDQLRPRPRHHLIHAHRQTSSKTSCCIKRGCRVGRDRR